MTTLPWRVAAALTCLASACCADPKAAVPASRPLTVQFAYTATVSSLPSGTRGLSLWIPLPSDSEWQSIRSLAVDSPIPHRITREPRYGNRMAYLHAEDPKLPLQVTVRFTVERRPVPALSDASPLPGRPEKRDSVAELRRLLAPDRLVPLGGRFADIAAHVAEGAETPLQKARALFDHVVATMRYDYARESPRLGEGDVAFVCDYRKGNCSDLHSYFISLARSLGIPAVLEYGLPIDGIPLSAELPREGTIGGYHCWVWIHDPSVGWLPVDASDARRWVDAGRPAQKDYLFGSLVTERAAVALSRGRDLTLSPRQKAGPLNYFVYPYAEANGRPIEVGWRIGYRVVRPSAQPRGIARRPPPAPARRG